MGKTIHLQKVKEYIAKSPVVSFESINRIISQKKKVKQYGKQLIRNLIRQGKLKNLAKGYYTSWNDLSLTVFCFQPAYLGLQDALSYHNLWEQETIPIVLTTKKTRRGIRKVMESNVLIRNIDKKYFFGFDYYKDGDFYIPYSDIEKTFIDMIYYKLYMDAELLKEFKKRIDKKKLIEYLKSYPKNIQKRVKSKL